MVWFRGSFNIEASYSFYDKCHLVKKSSNIRTAVHYVLARDYSLSQEEVFNSELSGIEKNLKLAFKDEALSELQVQ